jgi:hypothetical protein
VSTSKRSIALAALLRPQGGSMRHSTVRGFALLTRSRRRSRLLALSVIVGCVLVPTAAQAAPTPAVAAPRPSLTAQWWQTYAALPASQDPASRCDLGIDKIVFLGVSRGIPVSRSCTLRAGTSILVPLINIECSRIEDNGQTPAEWRACAEEIADDFTGLFLTINGISVDVTGLRVQSQPFAFRAVPDNTFDLPAGTSGSVSDGYWALIGPLAPGTYDISFGGSYPPAPFSTNTSYHLTVV